MFSNYPMAVRHISLDRGFFNGQGQEEAFLMARPPLSEDIIQDYRPKNPWMSSPKFEEDFVMVCEFSELEGPKPVMTIPKDSGGDVDQNMFALKIMAIDYNATNIVRSGGSFSLVEDTGVVLEDRNESACAYVHNFTLYDVLARGYVRPFCIAYITSDQRKIIRNLEWLTLQFRKASEFFRFGNRCQFQRDLKFRLADINYTIEELGMQQRRINGTKNPADTSEEDNKCWQKSKKTLSTLEKGVREVEEILRMLATELVNPKLEAHFKKLEQLSYSSERHKPRRHTNSSSIHEDGYHSDGEKKVSSETDKRRIRRCSTSDSFEDLLSSLEWPTSHTPQIIRMDGYRKFDIRLRTLHELCGWGCKAGLSHVRKIHKQLSRLPLILHMERQESRLVEPASTLLTIGRTVTTNFKQNISPLSPTHASTCSCHEGEDKHVITVLKRAASNTSTSSTGPCLDEISEKLSLLSYEARFVPGTAYASMESLYYDVNESLDQSSEDDEISEIPRKLLSNGKFVLSENGSWLEVEVNSKDSDCSSSDITNSQLVKGRCSADTQGSLSDEGNETQSQDDIRFEESLADVLAAFTPASIKEEFLHDSVVATPGSDTYVVRRNQKVSVGSYINRIHSFKGFLPGSGVRDVFGHYSFAVHLVYALLSGRTVIVVASPRYEKEVTSLIRTLWLFVPGHSSMHHLVVPWHTQALTLVDLTCMKLIGLLRRKSAEPIIPDIVKKYSTVFDYDASTLLTPPYKGYHLHCLVPSFKHFRSDRAYIAFIHSHFLELAQKAFVYYHSYSLKSPNFEPVTGNDMTKSSNSDIKNASRSFLTKLGLTDGDADIIEYWVEIIKQQKIDKMYVEAGSIIAPPPSLPLELRHCQLYSV